jgi:hypothetical protein
MRILIRCAHMRARVRASIFLFFAASCGTQETVPLGSRLELNSLVDFGDVAIGPPATIALPITNISTELVRLGGIDRGPGFDGDRYAFRVVDVPDQIAAGATAMIKVTFEAYGAMDEPIESSFGVVTDFGSARVTVRARGIAALSVQPARLDFGRVVRSESKTLTVQLANLLNEELLVRRVGDIEIIDGEGSFRIDGQVTNNVLAQLGPRAQGTIRVVYIPSLSRTAVGTDRGKLRLTYCDNHPICETVIDLVGQGSDDALQCDRTVIDFGGVEIGSTGVVNFVCTVGANAAVNVESVEVTGPAPPVLEVEPTARLPVRLEPGQELNFVAVWRPQNGADLTARVMITGRQPVNGRPIEPVEIPISGSRGTPAIQVTPATLDFGRAVIGTTITRSIRVASVGSRDLLVSEFTVDTAGTGSFSSPDGSSRTIPASSSESFTIEFRPVSSGRVTSELELRSNDPDDGIVRVTLIGEGLDIAPCQYQVVPNELDFGSVEPLRERTAQVVINNVGFEDCLMNNFTIGGSAADEYRLVSPPANDVLVGPGQNLRLDVQYRPSNETTHNANLSFYISDPLDPTHETHLRGRGVIDATIVYPDAIDFSTVAIGCSSETRTVRIYNGRESNAVISVAELAPSSSPAFELGVLNYPLTLTPADGTEFSIVYTPDGSGDDFAQLVITEANNPDPYVVWISGSGGGARQAEEQVVQGDHRQVDVLFVIDSSAGMFDEQTSMASEFAAFIAPADQAGIDYQLAMIDTTNEWWSSPCDRELQRPSNYYDGWCGYFADGVSMNVSDWKIITGSEQPSPGQAYADNIVIGQFGSGLEQPYANIRSALRAPISLGWNAGFLRREAALAVVLLSDENDGSLGDVRMYIDDLLGIHGAARKSTTSIHTIVADYPSGCMGPGGTAFEDGRFAEGVGQLGGTFHSICSSDWNALMGDVGLAVFGFRSTFVLENHPADGTLEVVIDGATVPEINSAGERLWSYDSTYNSVTFSPQVTPESGAELTFRYDTQCN